MNDPIGLNFVNQHVRPRAELLRALRALLQNTTDTWFSGVNNIIPNTSETIDDGRETQGVSRITGADVYTIMFRISQILEILNASNAMDAINKACVRRLEDSLGTTFGGI